MDSLDALSLALTAVGGGVAGWVLENSLFGPRYSGVFGGARVPLLPVYGAGAVAIALAAPALRSESWPVRGVVYAAILSGIEGAAGIAERSIGRVSWDYGGSPVDASHAIAWGLLGLAAEQVVGRSGVG